jgi:hypothetical protein
LTIQGGAIAETAIAAKAFALVEERRLAQKERAFQASSPKNFPGRSKDRPFFTRV